MTDINSVKDTQDIFELDLEKFVAKKIVPIDAIRSKTKSQGFIESRLNAFYRKLGLPVVNSDGQYFSPGIDINANSDFQRRSDVLLVKEMIFNNKELSRIFENREFIFKDYSRIFSSGNFNAKALLLGSMFIRSFKDQFGNTDPLIYDKNQTQYITERGKQLSEFYNSDETQTEDIKNLISSSKFISNHPLKPFIVDPRISIHPDSNNIAAPFLLDGSQLKYFNNLSYQRPYIETVISFRLNNKNNIQKRTNISQILLNIKNNPFILNKELINLANSPETNLQNSDAFVFNNYLKQLKILINTLIKNINELIDVRKQINFQVIPDTINGLEGPVSLEKLSNGDINNKEIDNTILELSYLLSLNKSASLTGNTEDDQIVNENNFLFSDPDDDTIASSKSEAIYSIETNYKKLINRRNQIGANGIDSLKNIEYIMGEFSGLGLIDIVAIRAAFWLISYEDLLGLIDEYTYNRLTKYRKNLNASGISRTTDIMAALKGFEDKVKEIYSFIQIYFDQVFNGAEFNQ